MSAENGKKPADHVEFSIASMEVVRRIRARDFYATFFAEQGERRKTAHFPVDPADELLMTSINAGKRRTGTVLEADDGACRGIIREDGTGSDLFFHYSDILVLATEMAPLFIKGGQKVSFEAVMTRNGLQAAVVRFEEIGWRQTE